MELRGPRRHREYPDHGYFLLSRQMIIASAAIRRKKTFLGSEAWRAIPWEKHPEIKTPFHEVLGIWAEEVGFSEEMTAIEEKSDKGEDVTDLRNETIATLGSLEAKLFDWRYEWEKRNPKSVTEKPVDPKTSRTVDRDGVPTFETVLWYKNMELAIEILV
jgi:hypothetical protein